MNALSLLYFSVIMAVLLFLHISWARYRLKNWAQKNRYQITQARFCFLNLGPFSLLGTSSGQYVFKLEVINEQGQRRSGYARVGGFFFGLLRRRVEVKWDKSNFDL